MVAMSPANYIPKRTLALHFRLDRQAHKSRYLRLLHRTLVSFRNRDMRSACFTPAQYSRCFNTHNDEPSEEQSRVFAHCGSLHKLPDRSSYNFLNTLPIVGIAIRTFHASASCCRYPDFWKHRSRAHSQDPTLLVFFASQVQPVPHHIFRKA